MRIGEGTGYVKEMLPQRIRPRTIRSPFWQSMMRMPASLVKASKRGVCYEKTMMARDCCFIFWRISFCAICGTQALHASGAHNGYHKILGFVVAVLVSFYFASYPSLNVFKNVRISSSSFSVSFRFPISSLLTFTATSGLGHFPRVSRPPIPLIKGFVSRVL